MTLLQRVVSGVFTWCMNTSWGRGHASSAGTIADGCNKAARPQEGAFAEEPIQGSYGDARFACPKGQRGQALAEYGLLVGFELAMLFLPVIRFPADDTRYSVMTLIFRAYDIYWESFHTVLGLPFP